MTHVSEIGPKRCDVAVAAKEELTKPRPKALESVKGMLSKAHARSEQTVAVLLRANREANP